MKANRIRVSIMLSKQEAHLFRELVRGIEGSMTHKGDVSDLLPRLEKLASRAVELHEDRHEAEVMQSLESASWEEEKVSWDEENKQFVSVSE